jgi:hypothetical protein
LDVRGPGETLVGYSGYRVVEGEPRRDQDLDGLVVVEPEASPVVRGSSAVQRQDDDEPAVLVHLSDTEEVDNAVGGGGVTPELLQPQPVRSSQPGRLGGTAHRSPNLIGRSGTLCPP